MRKGDARHLSFLFRSKSELYQPIFKLMQIVRRMAEPWDKREASVADLQAQVNEYVMCARDE